MNNLNFTAMIKQLVFVGVATYIISGLIDVSQMIIYPITAMIYFAGLAVEMYRHIGEDWSEQVEQEKKINANQANELRTLSEALAAEKRSASDRAAGYKADLANFEQVVSQQKRLIGELEAELERTKADKRQLGDAKLYQEIEAMIEASAMPSANKTHKWIVAALEKAINQSVTASQNGAGRRAS